MVIGFVNQVRINFSINTRHYTFTAYQGKNGKNSRIDPTGDR
jgi:hypothetical protein